MRFFVRASRNSATLLPENSAGLAAAEAPRPAAFVAVRRRPLALPALVAAARRAGADFAAAPFFAAAERLEDFAVAPFAAAAGRLEDFADVRFAPPARLAADFAVERLEAPVRPLDVLLRGSAMCPPSGSDPGWAGAYRAAIRATTGA
jgi:hypothetical protein